MSKKLYLKYCSTAVTVCLIVFSSSQISAQKELYDVQSWNTSDGLPQNSVNGITQDSTGFIWFTTYEGLVQFDGTRFKLFDKKEIPEIPSNRLNTIVSGKGNELYIFSHTGSLTFKSNDNEFTTHEIKPNSVYQNAPFYHDSIGLVFPVYGKVYRLKNGEIQELFEAGSRDNAVTSLTFSEHNKSFYGSTTRGDYFRADSDLNVKQIIEGEDESVAVDIKSRGDSLFAFNFNHFLILHNDSVVYRYEHHFDPNYASAMEIQKSKIVAASKSGVYTHDYTNGETTQISQNGLLPTNQPKITFSDKEGNIWVGSTTDGLFLITPRFYRFWNARSGLTHDIINPVFYADGNCYIGPSCRGITEIKPEGEIINTPKVHDLDAAYSDHFNSTRQCVWAIYRDSQKNWWYGLANEGLIKKENDGKTRHYREELHTPAVKAVLEIEGEVWIGCDPGLSCYSLEADTFIDLKKRYPDLPEQDKLYVNHFYQTSDGSIVLTTFNNGFFILKPSGEVEHLDTENGLQSNHARAVYEDQDNNLWIGTYGGGLSVLKPGADSLQTIDERHGLYDDVVSAIEVVNGTFYMTCNKGLYAAERKDLLKVLNGEKPRIYCASFAASKRTGQVEFNGGLQQNSARDENGNLLFPSFKGLMVFNPNRIPSIDPPKVLYQSIKVDDRALDQNAGEQLIDNNFLTIRFEVSAPVFAQAHNLFLEYRLRGYNERWVPVRSDRVIEFNKLPHGDYTLETRAKHVLAEEDEVNRAEFSFTVQTPWWQRPLMLLAAGAVIVVLFLVVLAWSRMSSARRELRIEKLLRERTAQLSESSANLKTVINNTDQLIWCLDQDYKLLTANDNYLEVFKKRTGKSLKKGDPVLQYADEQNIAFWEPIFKKVLNGEKVRFERKTKTGSGKTIINEVNCHPIKENGKVSGIAGFTANITDQKIKEQELREATKAAKAAAKSKSEFLATMSHEIRTPMNAVIGMTSLLMATDLDEKQAEYVRNIRISGETLLHVINDILDFSKAESGKLLIEAYDFNIKKSIENTVKLIENQAREKELYIDIEISEQIPEYVRGDETKLRQVILNLLGNAIKFTKEGGIKISAVLSSEKKKNGHMINFSIEDTGIGIPEKKLNKLFKPFSQVDAGTNRKYGGTGLGLAISKKLVRLMKGDIQVESTVGKGTIFHFTLPFQQRSQSEGQDGYSISGCLSAVKNKETYSRVEKILSEHNIPFAQKDRSTPAAGHVVITDDEESVDTRFPTILIVYHGEEMLEHDENIQVLPVEELTSEKLLELINELSQRLTPDSQTAQDLKPLNILVAEDNPVNQKLVQMILSKLGYSCDTVANGLEVLDALERRDYDLVYMDCQMPEMDGYEASIEIRKNKKYTDLIIVAMTANAMKDDREKCINAGMDDYLPKPIDLEIVKENLIKWSHHIHFNKTSHEQ